MIARTLLALALVATLVRAVLPAGYMLAAGPGGGLLRITLCTGHGAETAFLDLRTGNIVPDDGSDADASDETGSSDDGGPCAFSSLAQLARPDAAPALLSASFAEEQPPASLDLRPGRGLAAPPPWATGPPHAA